MKFIFLRQKGFIPSLIRFFDGGFFNHVAVLEDSAYVIEAQLGTGVSRNLVYNLRSSSEAFAIVELSGLDDTQGLTFLRKQLGKQYDLPAIFGLFIRDLFGSSPNIENRMSWYCDELMLQTAVEAGMKRPDKPLRNFGIKDSYSYLLEQGASVIKFAFHEDTEKSPLL